MSAGNTINLPYLDGWRGLAILGVLIAHFGTLWHISWFGEMGVQLFFVLSGYLMSNLLFIKRVELPLFFFRRLSRILPAFVVFVIAMAVYSLMQIDPYIPRVSEIAAALTFVRGYFPADISVWESRWPIGNLWSLNVEEHSYIYLALTALVTRYFGRQSLTVTLLFLSAAITYFFIIYYPAHPPANASPWQVRSEAAAFGLLISAAIRVSLDGSKISFAGCERAATIVSVSVAALCYFIYQHKGVNFTVAPLMLAIGINYLDRAPALVRYLLSNSILGWFGRCSFSLYLWQQPFYDAVKHFEIPFWAGLIGAMAVGSISYYIIEKPAREWLNGRKWRPDATGEIDVSAA